MLEEDDARLFLCGACHVFALALHESFNYPIVLLQDTTAEQSKSATHVYCRFSNCQSVDVVGIAREEDALAELDDTWIGAKYRRLKVSPNELQNYFTLTEGGGLYADAEFLRVARARAETQINTYKAYYSGAIASAVPGLNRRPVALLEDLQDIYS